MELDPPSARAVCGGGGPPPTTLRRSLGGGCRCSQKVTPPTERSAAAPTSAHPKPAGRDFMYISCKAVVRRECSSRRERSDIMSMFSTWL